jgi:hypothetical protein
MKAFEIEPEVIETECCERCGELTDNYISVEDEGFYKCETCCDD